MYFESVIPRYSLILLIILASCFHRKEGLVMAPKAPVFVVADTGYLSSNQLHMVASLRALYSQSDMRALWFDSLKRRPEADSLVAILSAAEQFGLNTNDYQTEEINQLLNDSTVLAKAKAEVYLSDAFLLFRSHLRSGRLSLDSLLPKSYSDVVDSAGINYLLRPAKGLRDFLSTSQPNDPEYFAILDTLNKMQRVVGIDSSVSTRMKQCIVGLERIRSGKRIPARCIYVNIPAFRMDVREKDSTVLTSAVVVGKDDSRTPLLESVVRSFIIYPYWHVPRGIAVRELLPHIKSDTSYLEKHRYEVLDKAGNVLSPDSISWDELNENNFPYTLRQRDGHENALGIIKFHFDNPFNVFLHDTNAKRHFAKKKRALSHGCVRVQKAVELARYLVSDDNIYITPEDLDQYLALRQRYSIKVKSPIPVILDYRTCEVLGGNVIFHDDVYGYDQQLYQALGNPVKDIPHSSLAFVTVSEP